MGTNEVVSLAAAQHGVVAIRQLRGLGLTDSQVARLEAHHGWERLSSAVLRRTGSPRTAAQRVVAAVLDVGADAALSHASAAAWWGHRGSRLEHPIHVVTTRTSSRRSELARVHRVRLLDQRWVTDRGGVAVVRPELVALQLFAQHRYERAERIVESMWSQGMLSGHSIGALLEDLGRRGRDGTAGLRRYHLMRGDQYRPPDSGLESRVQQILDGVGIQVRRQVDLGGERHWSGRVDFRHVELPLVIEVQSELHHTSRVDRAADLERIRSLAADGFEVVEVTDAVVWTDPAELVRSVRRAMGRARRLQLAVL